MSDVRPVVMSVVMSAVMSAVTPSLAHAQSAGELHLRRILSVPIGALPPVAMLMPASRNHNYWVGRVQAGAQWEGNDVEIPAAAVTLDLQWRGGSAFGVTAGYQSAGCELAGGPCPAHPMFGARGRFNLITGGPTIAALINDYSATTTFGADIGYGYAPDAYAGNNACALDIGMPVSLSLFQRVRVVSFLSPGVAWDVRCPVNGSVGSGASTLLGAGIGLQQIFLRGLDISFGAQRIFRRGAGIQVGVSVTYVALP